MYFWISNNSIYQTLSDFKSNPWETRLSLHLVKTKIRFNIWSVFYHFVFSRICWIQHICLFFVYLFLLLVCLFLNPFDLYGYYLLGSISNNHLLDWWVNGDSSWLKNAVGTLVNQIFLHSRNYQDCTINNI